MWVGGEVGRVLSMGVPSSLGLEGKIYHLAGNRQMEGIPPYPGGA